MSLYPVHYFLKRMKDVSVNWKYAKRSLNLQRAGSYFVTQNVPTRSTINIKGETMSEKDDGGRVYPNPYEGKNVHPNVLGITRRDWLAGLAMQGMMGDSNNLLAVRAGSVKDQERFLLAKIAYEFADAMIAESNK